MCTFYKNVISLKTLIHPPYFIFQKKTSWENCKEISVEWAFNLILMRAQKKFFCFFSTYFPYNAYYLHLFVTISKASFVIFYLYMNIIYTHTHHIHFIIIHNNKIFAKRIPYAEISTRKRPKLFQFLICLPTEEKNLFQFWFSLFFCVYHTWNMFFSVFVWIHILWEEENYQNNNTDNIKNLHTFQAIRRRTKVVFYPLMTSFKIIKNNTRKNEKTF